MVQKQPVYVIRDQRNLVGYPGQQIASSLLSRVCAFEHRWDAEELLQKVEEYREYFGKWPRIGMSKGDLGLGEAEGEEPLMVDFLDLEVEEEELTKLKAYCHARGLAVDVIGRRDAGPGRSRITTFAPRPTYKQYRPYLQNLLRSCPTE